jgi:hypothetical protein
MYPSRIAYWVLTLNQRVRDAIDLQKERESHLSQIETMMQS